MGITTRVIRDLFSEEVSEVYVDQEEDYLEIQSYLGALGSLSRLSVPHLLRRGALHLPIRRSRQNVNLFLRSPFEVFARLF
jgi:hypothetical protein